MVGLGFWQLARADEKAQLLAQYENARTNDEPVTFPRSDNDNWFRKSMLVCESVLSVEATAGTAANGAKGWAHRVTCDTRDSGTALVDIGFSRDPASPEWSGGSVEGRIAPGPRLVADPAVAGLGALAKPDPGELPNNHMAYAVQWFFFALTALVIYFLAIRGRIAKRD